MTPNDTQMDLLMRRYAKGAKQASVSTEHLDADELNAFTEGALPAATRSRYVSHLADCDDCRTVASQLAMAAGARTIAEIPASEVVVSPSWWERFSTVLSAPALRYATSAVVLLAVLGVSFIVWRRSAQQPGSTMIARNEPNQTQVNAASSPPAATTLPSDEIRESLARNAGANAQPTPGTNVDKKGSESPFLDAPAAPKPAKDAAEAEASSAIASDRVMKAPQAEPSPGYAPPPPAENYRVDTRQREQQVQVQQQQVQQQQSKHGGPRRNENYEKYKVSDDRARATDMAKGRDEDRSRAAATPTTTTENKQEQSGVFQSRTAPGALSAPKNTAKESDEEARKADVTVRGRATSNEPTSVGGRKFRRQGNVWVDLKFKSSMSVKTVTRGSEDFAELDSKLRSIAQQLGGEVIVVWKGKAYRIR